MKLKPLNQQVVVIMGATSGIGRAAALLLAERGARLVVSGRSMTELEGLVQEIRSKGGEAAAVVAEVTDFEQVKQVAEQAVETFGGLDTWVHSSAIMMYASFEETQPEEFARMIEVNLLGQIYGAKAALPYLKEAGRGALIHISSIEGRRSLPLQSAYAASKHGMTGFIDTLRMELEHERLPIHVANVKPAGINTPLYDKALTRLGVKPRPVPPIYAPELVAEAIAYAAEHPVRDLEVGGAGKALTLVERLSPRLADKILMKIAYQGQHTDQPKSDLAPNNLFHHLEGFDKVEGPFSEETRQTSIYTQTRTRPAIKWGLAAAALTGAVVLSGRFFRAKT